jgi:hypothetical protein
MPDIIKISELDEALALADAAEFPFYQDNGGQNTTYKAPITQIGAKIVEGLTYQGINLPAGAGNKTVENSLNYLIDAVDGDPNGNISDSYDPTAAYVKGDLCIYENVLYICTAPTTGTFDPSKWTATTIDNVIGSLTTLTTSDKSSVVGAVNEIASYTPVYGNTASGAIATFDTSLALPLQDCTIDINAVQEGSGTPSPDNVRPITGFTGANIHVADNETPHIIDNVTAISWQSEAGTVYGGLLDVTSGVLTVTWALSTITGDDVSSAIKESNLYRVFLATSKCQMQTDYPNTISNKYTCRTTYTNVRDNDNSFALNNVNGEQIIIRDDTITSPTDLKDSLNNEPLTFIYPLATPVTYQLTPTQISAIVGTNNVFTDTNGNTSVMYACSLKDYIDRQ